MEKEHLEKIEVQQEEMRREQKENKEKLFRQIREQNEELKRIQNQNEENLRRLQIQQEENLRRLQIQQEENLRRLQIQQEENLRRIRIQHEEDLRRFRMMMMNSNFNIPYQAFDEEILKKLNKFVFNDDIKDKDGNIEKINCCICLNDIKKNEEVVKLPCNHIHHWKCCVNWLKQKNICPMCRFEIKK